MFTKYVLPSIAVLGLAFAVQTVAAGSKPTPVAAPVVRPAAPPFRGTIAGAGIVEAQSQNIAVGTPIPGVVAEVAVEVGATVAKGDLLFRLDDRDRRATSAAKHAALAAARAELSRLASFPRAEDVPPAEARVAAATAELADARARLEQAEGLEDKRAMATEEWNRRRFAVQTVAARVAEAEAELSKLRAGTWKPDLDVARARVASAESDAASADVEIERLAVRASVSGTVLQVNVRPGEYAPAGALATPLILLGDLTRLHVRVDIDENDAWRLVRGADARGFVRGNSALGTDLQFVRVEPYVVPKRSLTGESTERVDTRVLQVIYRFDPRALPVYVGQQLDVFIEAPAVPSGGASSPADSGGPK